MATIDLHIHSHYSNDADFSPTRLVQLAQHAGLTYAAVADHNSIKAVDEALSAAEQVPLTIIPAVEMDCVLEGVVLHLLGYGIDHSDPVFTEIEDDLHQQEKENSTRLMTLVRQLGIDFEDELVESLSFKGVITGEMIAEAALVFDSENKNPLLDPYRGDGDRSDNPYVNFYWDYCSQGKPAHVPMDFISIDDAIKIVRSNHGVPILAHPGINVKEDTGFLERIIDKGVAGIEVYSSYHNQKQITFYKEAVISNGLLRTCGSDFHGKTKKSIKIGGTDCEGQEERIINELLHAINQA